MTVSQSPLPAFQRRLDRTPRTGPTEVEIVCNDPKMNREFVNVHSEYGARDWLPVDVTVHYDLTTNEFESVLAKNSDFLHYIGHIDHDGFRCSNGRIDVTDIETVGVTAFFLNACQSYRQGYGLIELGSQAGIVTLADVENREAVEIGSTVARLLSYGFPLYATMDVTQTKRTSGSQYHLLGDGTVSVSQPESGPPLLLVVERRGSGRTIECHPYMITESTLGGIYRPNIDAVDSYHLLPSRIEETSVTKPQLVTFVESGVFPVLLDGELRWSNEISITEL